jgi:hypothetical protein
MKVYVVIDWWKHEESTIQGVFDSKEKAEDHSAYLKATVSECPDSYFTEIWEYILQ